MERRTDLNYAEKIMGRNFIGPEQLESKKIELGILSPFNFSIPEIPFSSETLKFYCNDYILILGIPKSFDNEPLTINKMRSLFGLNPDINEPCFYNQDWYLNETFAKSKMLDLKWYLQKKNISESERGKNVDEIIPTLASSQKLPSAILACYAFFTNYFINNKEILWKNDFLWCEDIDHNLDQIYVGRYIDPEGINKNGFNIHRHLKIRKNLSIADELLDSIL